MCFLKYLLYISDLYLRNAKQKGTHEKQSIFGWNVYKAL